MENKIFSYAKSCIGQNLAKKYGSLGCVEALRFIFKQATGKELADTYSTKTLYLSLKKDNRFQEVSISQAGDIIISPTGYGNGVIKNGHTGIISDDGTILSNNSATLLWDKHYTMQSWVERYARQGGFPIKFFRLIELPPPVLKKEEQMYFIKKLIEIYQQLKNLL